MVDLTSADSVRIARNWAGVHADPRALLSAFAWIGYRSYLPNRLASDAWVVAGQLLERIRGNSPTVQPRKIPTQAA